MILPRDGDKVRLYLRLMDADIVNPETGRVDRNKMGPEKLMKVASKTFHLQLGFHNAGLDLEFLEERRKERGGRDAPVPDGEETVGV